MFTLYNYFFSKTNNRQTVNIFLSLKYKFFMKIIQLFKLKDNIDIKKNLVSKKIQNTKGTKKQKIIQKVSNQHLTKKKVIVGVRILTIRIQ
jgi:hypothetical protein